MRELGEREIDRVSGGVFNLGTGVAGALIGGGFAGAGYAIEAAGNGTFSWSEFGLTVGANAVGGFLIGSGVTLIAAAASGATRGTVVAGVTSIGTGGIIEIVPNLSKLDDDGGS